MINKTLVVGASKNPERYAYKAAELLREHNRPWIGIGTRADALFGQTIYTDWSLLAQDHPEIHTVTLYLGPKNQEGLLQLLQSVHAQRVIFNPGTENPDLQNALSLAGIHWVEACTLVLLHTGQFELA